MSDEENEGEEAGEEEDQAEDTPRHHEDHDEEEEKPKLRKAPRPAEPEEEGEKQLTDVEKAMLAAKKKHEAEEAEKLREFEEQRAREREKEEEELRELKEKQERRKREREEEERIMAEQQAMVEERRRQDEEARLAKRESEKRRKEELKKKKEKMMEGSFGMAGPGGGKNFKLEKGDKVDQFGNVIKQKPGEQSPEERAEAKRAYLAKNVGQKNFGTMPVENLRQEIKQMHARIEKGEAAKYDLEVRSTTQEYDLRELTERQRQVNRNKLIKKGLDPEAANSDTPPKVAVSSKYDRQIDRRSYTDRHEMYNKPKPEKEKKVYHGTARPPSDWCTKNTEELENLRKNAEGTKRYVEAVPLEGAKPPVPFIPAQIPEHDPDDLPPAKKEAPEPAAATEDEEEEEEEE